MIKLFNIMKKNFINKRRRGKMKQGKKIVAILLALSLCLPFIINYENKIKLFLFIFKICSLKKINCILHKNDLT